MRSPSVYLTNKICFYLLSATVLACLYGCPFSSVYKLDQEPQLPVQDSYLGKWATMVTGFKNKTYPVKMILDKQTEYEYDIFFTGYLKDLEPFQLAVNDTIRGTAFMSMVGDRQVLNVKIRGEYFLVECKYQNGKLTLLPLCDHFTNKIIKRNSDLRLALEWHYKSRLYPFYDETFTLKEMVRVE